MKNVPFHVWIHVMRRRVHSVQHGVCSIPESSMTPTLSFSVHVTTVGLFTALFLLPVWNLTSLLCSSTPVSCMTREFPVICEHLRQTLAYICMEDFQDILAQNGGFRSKIGEGVVWGWPPTNSFLLYLCARFGKNRSRNATVWTLTDRQTDGHTHKQK